MPTVASRRLEARLPPPRPYRPRTKAAQPSLTQFVVLSMLLHAFLILLFGSPTGGSPEGRAMWGSLNVTIRGPLMDSGIGLKLDRSSGLRLPGPTLLERRDRERKEAPPPTPHPRPEARRAPPDLDAAREADVVVAPPLPPTMPVTPATADLMPAPRVEAAKIPVPIVPVPSIDWSPQKAADPALATPVEVARPIRVPDIPAPLMQRGATPAVSPRLEPSVELSPIATPVPPAPARPVPVPAPLMPESTTPAIAPSLASPVEVAPLKQEAPPAVSPQGAPDRGTPAATERPATRDPVPASREPVPSRSDSPIFNNRRPPAGDVAAPGTGPRIDLDAARARARQIAKEGTGNRALLPFPMPPAPERKTKEQIAIEKAWKPDCKDAYKGMGLLAVVPLIANEFGEGNCRW